MIGIVTLLRDGLLILRTSKILRIELKYSLVFDYFDVFFHETQIRFSLSAKLKFVKDILFELRFPYMNTSYETR